VYVIYSDSMGLRRKYFTGRVIVIKGKKEPQMSGSEYPKVYKTPGAASRALKNLNTNYSAYGKFEVMDQRRYHRITLRK